MRKYVLRSMYTYNFTTAPLINCYLMNVNVLHDYGAFHTELHAISKI